MRVRSFVFVGPLTLLTVALYGAAVLASPAVQGPVQPGPMPADHPLAKRAAAVVEQIVAGNRDAAIATMKKEGTAELAASPSLEVQVDGAAQTAGPGPPGEGTVTAVASRVDIRSDSLTAASLDSHRHAAHWPDPQ